jgi:alcohol dehydrogenase
MNQISTLTIPTQVIFGVNSHSRIPERVQELGAKGVFLITDKGVAQTDFCKKAMGLLQSSGIDVEVFDDVEPEPSAETMEKALSLFQKSKAKVLLAIGGGSSMDAAKCVGILATNGGSILDYGGDSKFKTPPIPLIALPTTAGTGSEVSHACVVTDTKRDIKISIYHPGLNRAKVAILDPLALTSLPASVAAHAGMDAFAHAFESYLSLLATPLTEGVSLYATELIAQNIRPFVANRGNLEAGGKMLVGSALSAVAFTSVRTGNVHCMARFVGAFFHVPHGLSNAVCLPYAAEFNMIACPEKYARVAQVMGIDTTGMTSMEAARAAVSAIKGLCEDVGIPQNLKELGVREEAIPKMAQLAFQAGYNRFNPRYTTEEDFLKLFRAALG